MKQLRQPSQLVAANISTTAGTELPTLTTAMLDEKSIRNCPRSRSFVCAAFCTGSPDEFGIQWSLTDRCVDLHLGAGDVLGHPGIGLVLTSTPWVEVCASPMTRRRLSHGEPAVR